MYKIKNIFILTLVTFVFVSCVNKGPDGVIDGLDYSDPDPLTEDEALTAPKAPASLTVFVNIDGEIRSFQADAPEDAFVVVTDASTEKYFEEFKLSDDGHYLLYVNADGDLILINLISSAAPINLQQNISSSEIQFIDNDSLQYSYGGDIYCYQISTGYKYVMINSPDLFCNHGAIVSPDGTKIVFKNQDPSQSEIAIYAWAEVTGDTVTSCTQLGTTEDIALLELLDFMWIDNYTIFMKPFAGVNTRIKTFTINSSVQFDANVALDNSVVQFTNLNISDDRLKLCFYGSFGCYQVDVSTLDLESQIEVDEIYTSSIIKTEFADYSIDSKYLVVSTSGCIGIYEAETLRQTDFESWEVISEGETLYYLCCN